MKSTIGDHLRRLQSATLIGARLSYPVNGLRAVYFIVVAMSPLSLSLMLIDEIKFSDPSALILLGAPIWLFAISESAIVLVNAWFAWGQRISSQLVAGRNSQMLRIIGNPIAELRLFPTHAAAALQMSNAARLNRRWLRRHFWRSCALFLLIPTLVVHGGQCSVSGLGRKTTDILDPAFVGVAASIAIVIGVRAYLRYVARLRSEVVAILDALRATSASATGTAEGPRPQCGEA